MNWKHRLLLAACTLAAPGAWTAPKLINYQGRLTDAAGSPVTQPTQIAFTFWDAATSGTQLGGGFSDVDTVRPDADGIYATLIGDDPDNLVPASVFQGDAVWLNVSVEGEDLVPRKRLTAVAYALQSDHATSATFAETAGASETTQTEIDYQPWFWWWWWPLPWRLGYPYERIVTIADPAPNVDCRTLLYDRLHQDAESDIADPALKSLTHQALDNGRAYDPTSILFWTNDRPAGIVAVIDRCTFINSTTAVVSFTLYSNKTSSDIDPRVGTGSPPSYPWIPGRSYRYHFALVHAGDPVIDLDSRLWTYHHQWWTSGGTDFAVVNPAMTYFVYRRRDRP